MLQLSLDGIIYVAAGGSGASASSEEGSKDTATNAGGPTGSAKGKNPDKKDG